MNKQNFIDKNKPDYVYKVLILGDMCVGKTCMLLRYCDNVFNDNHISTIGVDYRVKSKLINNDNIKLQIWDTAGQEKFKSMIKMYYKNAHAAIVVFDVTNIQSFDKAQSWVDELIENTNSNTVIALCGNKVDLEENRKVSYDEGCQFAEKIGAFYIEVSAKNKDRKSVV